MPVILKDSWDVNDPFGIHETDHDDAPGIETNRFAQALQVWSICQPHGASTVQAASLAFSCTPEQIEHAIDGFPWMYVLNGMIEHDGE